MTRPARSSLRRVALGLAATTAVAGLAIAPSTSSDAQAAARPGPTLSREVVGLSVEGREITLIHRAHAGATTRVLVIGSIHGDEQAGMRVVRRLVRRHNLPADLDLWMLKTVNPDGVVANRRTNAHGVDLNRNFGYNWHTSARGATWSGPRPMSEPESVVLRHVVRRVDPWLVVTFHQPLLGVGAHDKDMKTVRALAKGMALPVRDFNCTGVCYGTFSGWVNNRTDGFAVTVEFGHSASAWRIARATSALVQVGTAGPPGRTPQPTVSPTPSLTPTPTASPTPTPSPAATLPTETPAVTPEPTQTTTPVN